MGSILSPRLVPAALPEDLPVFPLAGAMLLPHARLPLNIFEPRYLAMVEDALARGRMIGMIQPSHGEDGLAKARPAPLFSVGCAGRITSFNETDDGRLLIVLTGVCRFRVDEETTQGGLYRTVRPDWKPYLADLGPPDELELDRDRLVEMLQVYFRKHSIGVDWKVVQGAPDDVLLATIIMICPFAINEKQALLEAGDAQDRARMLMTLLRMAVNMQGDGESEVRH